MGTLHHIHPELITVYELAIGSGRAYARALYAECPAEQLQRALREELSAPDSILDVRSRGFLRGQREAVSGLIMEKSSANPARTGGEG